MQKTFVFHPVYLWDQWKCHQMILYVYRFGSKCNIPLKSVDMSPDDSLCLQGGFKCKNVGFPPSIPLRLVDMSPDDSLCFQGVIKCQKCLFSTMLRIGWWYYCWDSCMMALLSIFHFYKLRSHYTNLISAIYYILFYVIWPRNLVPKNFLDQWANFSCKLCTFKYT